jgi:hypothetical protein
VYKSKYYGILNDVYFVNCFYFQISPYVLFFRFFHFILTNARMLWKFLFSGFNVFGIRYKYCGNMLPLSFTLKMETLGSSKHVINCRINISSVTEPPSSTWAPLITMRTDASARPAPAHCLPTAWRSINYRLKSVHESLL